MCGPPELVSEQEQFVARCAPAVRCQVLDPYDEPDAVLADAECRRVLGDPHTTFWTYFVVRYGSEYGYLVSRSADTDTDHYFLKSFVKYGLFGSFALGSATVAVKYHDDYQALPIVRIVRTAYTAAIIGSKYKKVLYDQEWDLDFSYHAKY